MVELGRGKTFFVPLVRKFLDLQPDIKKVRETIWSNDITAVFIKGSFEQCRKTVSMFTDFLKRSSGAQASEILNKGRREFNERLDRLTKQFDATELCTIRVKLI